MAIFSISMTKPNPEILRWARETAGLSLGQAAKKLSLGGKKNSGAAILKAFESGEKVPTRKKLDVMSAVYRRPLIVFFLPKPPPSTNKGEDFRTLPESLSEKGSGTLQALLRDIYVRQELMRDALVDAEDDERISFVGAGVGAGVNRPDVTTACAFIKDYFKINMDIFRNSKNAHESFKYIRGLVEDKRIFVLLLGDLGSHHSALSPEIFRGFALSDPVCPFVIINNNDAKSAWSFTLLHELAHIWMNKTGVSAQSHEHDVEKYCNDVASMILMPEVDLQRIAASLPAQRQDMVRYIQENSSNLNVSSSLICYRLLRSGRLDMQTWSELSSDFRELWKRSRDQKKAQAKESGGGSYYVTQRHRVGNALIQTVRRSLREGVISETKAGKVLGVKPGNVAEMVGV